MLSMLINYGKKVLLILIMAAMVLVNLPMKEAHADYSENSMRKVDIVIRAGEWGNNKEAKPGKRYNWGTDINISQHGINIKDIPTDIPLRREGNEWFISEFDINLKLARAIATKLDQKYGVDVNLQYATSKSQDLNAAGRIARRSEPKIYLSVHHNAYTDTSTGYFIMSNKGDVRSSMFAKKMADNMKNNGMIPQRENRANDGYIGELNEIGKALETPIRILGEFGYFNKAEIVKICSDKYVDYVSDKVAESLYEQLKELDYEAANDVMFVQANTTKEQPDTVTVRLTEDTAVVENETIVLKFK